MSCDPAGTGSGPNLYEANRSDPINMTDTSGAWPEFVKKGMTVVREVAAGALRSEKELAKEVATTAIAATPIGQMVQFGQTASEIWSSKDSVAATVAVAKDKITTIAPPAATGFALLEGRGLHAGVEDTLKKVPFSKVATDVEKTVRAAGRGDTAGVVEHGTASARHFAQQVGALVLAAGGETAAPGPSGAAAKEPPSLSGGGSRPSSGGEPFFSDLSAAEVNARVDSAEGGTGFQYPGQHPITGEGLLHHEPNATATNDPDAAYCTC